MKPTQSEKWNNLKRVEGELIERVKGLKGQLSGLANDPTQPGYSEKVQAIQGEIAERTEQLRQAQIAVKQAEIELLEME
jgi:hypothetical protein